MPLPDLLTLGSRWTFVGGKGGVGKTTTAAALAVTLADAGRDVLALSLDPAHSLGDALGVALGGHPAPVPGVPRLSAMELDAHAEQERFLDANRAALLGLIERGTYLDTADAAGLLDLSLPGVDEVTALYRLARLAGGEAYVVVDTAPTGHTLRLLDLVQLAHGWIGAFEAMQERHRAVALAMAGAYRPDEATALLQELRDELDGLSSLLTDAGRTRFVLVTNPGAVVVAETLRYQEALAVRDIALAGVVVNRADADLARSSVGRGMLFVPRLARDPQGPDGLRAFAAGVSPEPAGAEPHETSGAGSIRVGDLFELPADRFLHIVGGKGGVGKSTASAALALRLANERTGQVLLLSVDPAGSLAEVLEAPIGAVPREVAPRVFAQQLDADRAWSEFRNRYRDRAAHLLGGVVAGDRDVVERLIDMAPPGIDELVAILQVVDLTGDRSYDAVVLDTAPTGHLLRLLELPSIALEWTRELMRVLLKYREVIGLGELATNLMELSRDLRELQERLRDPAQTWFLAVALPEALGVPEMDRLLTGLHRLTVPTGALLLNRTLTPEGHLIPVIAGDAGRLLSRAGALPCGAAPEFANGPGGVHDLRSFAGAWKDLRTD